MTPNLRATQVELYDGLQAYSQNRWPSLRLDVGAVSGLLSPFIPAGFYYKTFMWPRDAWRRLYEPKIRAAAGLGRAPEAGGSRYLCQSVRALRRAGRRRRAGRARCCRGGCGQRGAGHPLRRAIGGRRVAAGGVRRPLRTAIEGEPADQWLASTLRTLAANPRVTLLPRTTAFGYFPHNLIGLNQRLTDHLARPDHNQPRERQWQVRAREVVLANGAIERPLVFPGNDRPGILLAEGGPDLPQSLRHASRIKGRPGDRMRWGLSGCSRSASRRCRHRGNRGRSYRRDRRPTVRNRKARWPAHRDAEHCDRYVRPAPRPRDTRAEVGCVRRSGRAGEAHALRPGSDVGGSDPERAPLLAVAWKVGLGREPECLPARRSPPSECAARVHAAGSFHSRRRSVDGTHAGLAAAESAGLAITGAKPEMPAPESSAAGVPGALPQPPGVDPQKAFVDWQNDVTVARSRARGPGGLPLHRAREALHDHRNGHRSGKDVQHQRARNRCAGPRQGDSSGRADDLPDALHARELR